MNHGEKRLNKDDLFVGMPVFLAPGGNYGYMYKGLQEGEIEKIGRKYFHVRLQHDRRGRAQRFEIETLTYARDEDHNGYFTKSAVKPLPSGTGI